MISKKGFDFMAKKLVSLLLVVMLAVGVFSMQALAATGDDDIEPYGITIPCPKCGSPTYAIDRDYYGVRPSQNECGLGYGHNHQYKQTFRDTYCSSANCSYHAVSKVGSEKYWQCLITLLGKG